MWGHLKVFHLILSELVQLCQSILLGNISIDLPPLISHQLFNFLHERKGRNLPLKMHVELALRLLSFRWLLPMDSCSNCCPSKRLEKGKFEPSRMDFWFFRGGTHWWIRILFFLKCRRNRKCGEEGDCTTPTVVRATILVKCYRWPVQWLLLLLCYLHPFLWPFPAIFTYRFIRYFPFRTRPTLTTWVHAI